MEVIMERAQLIKPVVFMPTESEIVKFEKDLQVARVGETVVILDSDGLGAVNLYFKDLTKWVHESYLKGGEKDECRNSFSKISGTKV
jgi:hypothetical protein